MSLWWISYSIVSVWLPKWLTCMISWNFLMLHIDLRWEISYCTISLWQPKWLIYGWHLKFSHHLTFWFGVLHDDTNVWPQSGLEVHRFARHILDYIYRSCCENRHIRFICSPYTTNVNVAFIDFNMNCPKLLILKELNFIHIWSS